MRVFIANFGAQNYLWPKCLARSTIGTYESEDLRPFSESDDRAGFIARCLATKKTERGITPTVPVASRWFNIGRIVSTTANDIWIHREKGDLWWTSSRDGEVEVSLQPAFGPAHARETGLYVFLYPEDNEACRAAVQLYREFLSDTRTFEAVTLERTVDAISAEVDAPWVREVRDRYLGWEKIARMERANTD